MGRGSSQPAILSGGITGFGLLPLRSPAVTLQVGPGPLKRRAAEEADLPLLQHCSSVAALPLAKNFRGNTLGRFCWRMPFI
jgi:hypothetical protein